MSVPEYAVYGSPDLAPTAQNPTIVPVFDPFIVEGENASQFLSPLQFAAQFPRLPAKGTVTLTGSVTVGDTCFIDLLNGMLPGGVVNVAVLALSGDTLSTLAQKLSAAINTNPVLRTFGVISTTSVVGSDPVIALTWPGPLGNVTASVGWSYLSHGTITIGGSATADDIVGLNFASATLPASIGTATIGGSATDGDVIGLTFTNGSFAEPVTISYTMDSDTLITAVTALVALINADATLATIGLVASANDLQISLAWDKVYGQVTLAQSISRDATETLVVLQQSGDPSGALEPAPAPSALVTVGGSATTGDIVALAFTCSGLFRQFPTDISYAVQGGDDTDDIASELTDLINANALLATANFLATVVGSVITIIWSPNAGVVGIAGSVAGVPSETFATAVAMSNFTLSYTVQGGDDTSDIADALDGVMDADVILAAAGVIASVSGAIITAKWNGNLIPLTVAGALSEGATETVTFVASQSTSQTITISGSATNGDTLNAKFVEPSLPGGSVTVSVDIVTSETTTAMALALANAINADADLVAAGISASPSGAVITVATSLGAGEPTITVWGHGAAKLDTLGGTLTTGDVLNLTVTNAVIGSYLLQYVVQSGDTTLALLATSLAHAISVDSYLLAAGFSATAVGAVVHINWPVGLGVVSFGVSQNGTTTATVGGTATNGEIPTLTIHDAGLSGGANTYSYTETVPSDTNTDIAAAFAALINADTEASDAGITATSLGAVITIVSASVNPTTYTRVNSVHTTITLAGGATETQTLSAGPTEIGAVTGTAFGTEVLTATSPLVGGAGPIIPLNNFQLAQNNVVSGSQDVSAGTFTDFWRGKPVLIDFQTLQNLVAAAEESPNVIFM